MKKGNQALNTVNVLEILDGTPYQIKAFQDNIEGNKKAETLFRGLVKEKGVKNKDIDSYLEDGSYEYYDYGVYLIHST